VRQARIRRPVRLLDLMALVAAVALTLVSHPLMKAVVPADSHDTWDRRQYVIHLASLVLSFWTATLFALVLSGPRAEIRRACRCPGHAALFAVAAAFSFLAVQQVVTALILAGIVGWPPRMVRFFWAFNVLEPAADASAASVIAVWLILALTRTGRASSSWLDRLGCALGLIWILWGLVNHLVGFLPIRWLQTSGIW
jgi:hypothetical protein